MQVKSKVKAKVVLISSMHDALSKFVDAFEKVSKGEDIKPEDTVGFDSLEELNKVLTPKRLELINAVRRYAPDSVKELASIVNRDLRNVYRDLKILQAGGFIKLYKTGKKVKPIVDYDEIVIKLT